MPTYAIGDIQGCYDQLRDLLNHIGFNRKQDKLWFAGDLVNRGPKSLKTLRFIKNLGDSAISVLGNHDLHVIAIARGFAKPGKKDQIKKLMKADDRDELLTWLLERPLLHHDTGLGMTLIHAGLPPQWDLDTARACAREVEAVLRGPDPDRFFKHMYGNKPRKWNPELEGWDRLRFITNSLTRLRYCDDKGRMCLTAKGAPGSQPKPYIPWFQVPDRLSKDMEIIFGHWSTLGEVSAPGIHALDTGCLWGGELTALRLEDRQRFSIGCPHDLHLYRL